MTIQVKDFGNHRQLIVKNKEGRITACLYILTDGMVHGDSWICAEGWGR